MKHTVDLKIDTAIDKADLVLEKSLKQFGRVLVTYIVADTIRQVIIAQATK